MKHDSSVGINWFPVQLAPEWKLMPDPEPRDELQLMKKEENKVELTSNPTACKSAVFLHPLIVDPVGFE